MKNALNLLEDWTRALPSYLRPSRRTPYQYYGTGESAHWPVQSNFNVAAALAVLGTHADYHPIDGGLDSNLLVKTALSLFRYGLSTHVGGPHTCTDGKQWGHSWISVLGLERMRHGLESLAPHLTAQDRARLKEVLLSEADWILDHHPVIAGIEAKDNRPESNIWNGCHLIRSAMEYPDAPRRDAYLEKATSFFLNGISVPADASSSTIYRGKPLATWHVGPNFTENYGLNHHHYLNIGYMVICLSNIAMLHFAMKERGTPLPDEVYHHVEDLWKVVKSFTFADGRLHRIGGDTRARYCYCQDYAYPVWLFASDHFKDDTTSFESGWLKILATEMAANGDGSFLSKRLAAVRASNWFYFARLESDRALALSQAAYWGPKAERKKTNPIAVPDAWEDGFHGAVAHRSRSRLASWVWKGAEGPALICVPPDRSDLVEWQKSLLGEFCTAGHLCPQPGRAVVQTFPGGFAACGQLYWKETLPMGEGEGTDILVDHQVAAVALPDGRSMIVLQRAKTMKDCILTEVKSLGLKIPNDLWNGDRRHYRGSNKDYEAAGIPADWQRVSIDSPALTVDETLTLTQGYGPTGFHIFRPPERRIAILRATPPRLGTLYADEVCLRCEIGSQFYPEDSRLIDDGFALTLAHEPKGLELRQVDPFSPEVRAVRCTDERGSYLFVANFGAKTTTRLPSEFFDCQILTSGSKPTIEGKYLSMEMEEFQTALFRI
ncbi:MAG: hypothetical protein J0L75_16350 [Spirochaetes bacterium]|nr:hypothetical protein [Spirochaetota bacterium]